nr:hypothetical protein [Kibdelosporangium sp. MJ126-NF4]CEL23007.1 putative cytochrome P450 hydroxylase [Kibdelosporangium sp. MJ126-NF4]CTQ90147.1 putative cytochrome P450 hydroxylase [Kibdelosporangium sp. MJ126-NF4]
MSPLTDVAYTIPPVPDGGPPVGIRWLRRTIARFSDGTDHTRRRELATDRLAALDIADLRQQATERTLAILDAAGARPVDLMAEIARVVPVDVISAALGTSLPVSAVAAVARAYQPGVSPDEPADEAVTQLVDLLGGAPDERTAAHIALLAQVYDATAGLIGNAAIAMLRSDGTSADVVITETLRLDPPVRATRRAEPGTGEIVTVDLADSGLPFGAGPHQCPGRDHAVAVTAGTLDGLRGCRLGGGTVDYVPSPVLRIPRELMCSRAS